MFRACEVGWFTRAASGPLEKARPVTVEPVPSNEFFGSVVSPLPGYWSSGSLVTSLSGAEFLGSVVNSLMGCWSSGSLVTSLSGAEFLGSVVNSLLGCWSSGSLVTSLSGAEFLGSVVGSMLGYWSLSFLASLLVVMALDGVDTSLICGGVVVVVIAVSDTSEGTK